MTNAEYLATLTPIKAKNYLDNAVDKIVQYSYKYSTGYKDFDKVYARKFIEWLNKPYVETK